MMTGIKERLWWVASTLKPDRAGIGLSGLVAIGVALGMAVAQHELMAAGLVEPRPAAEVLALPGFAFLFGGLVFVIGATAHAMVMDDDR